MTVSDILLLVCCLSLPLSVGYIGYLRWHVSRLEAVFASCRYTLSERRKEIDSLKVQIAVLKAELTRSKLASGGIYK